MARAWLLGGGLIVAVAATAAWRQIESARAGNEVFEPTVHNLEPAPVCPWREPEADLHQFFPEANRRTTETRILSGLRLELAQQLGRPPESEEMTLTVHRVFQMAQPLGAVLARRVKGEHGAIELVLAVTDAGAVCGLRLQRLREPAAIEAAVTDAHWLARFRGRDGIHGWEADDLSGLPVEARPSAAAVREGLRSLLVLLAVSQAAPPSQPVSDQL